MTESRRQKNGVLIDWGVGFLYWVVVGPNLGEGAEKSNRSAGDYNIPSAVVTVQALRFEMAVHLMETSNSSTLAEVQVAGQAAGQVVVEAVGGRELGLQGNMAPQLGMSEPERTVLEWGFVSGGRTEVESMGHTVHHTYLETVDLMARGVSSSKMPNDTFDKEDVGRNSMVAELALIAEMGPAGMEIPAVQVEKKRYYIERKDLAGKKVAVQLLEVQKGDPETQRLKRQNRNSGAYHTDRKVASSGLSH